MCPVDPVQQVKLSSLEEGPLTTPEAVNSGMLAQGMLASSTDYAHTYDRPSAAALHAGHTFIM